MCAGKLSLWQVWTSYFVFSTFKVSLHVVSQFDLDVIQCAVLSAMVPAIVFLVVPIVSTHVSVCEVDSSPWFELVVCVCVEGVGADEGCECKLHDEVEARLILRPQRA